MKRLWIACVPLLLASGCAAHDRQSLQEAVFEYSHGVRWNRPGYVTRYLAAKSQQEYLAQRDRLPDLRVTACRVASVRVRSGERATVVLNVGWFRLTQGRVFSTQVEQTWARKGRRWKVVSQAWLRGAPLPIFPNPAVKRTSI